jgi:Leucine-rich repeat (LRR) protein
MKTLKSYEKYFENNNETELELSFKNLAELPELPNNLKILGCSYNSLTELSELPRTLEKLLCNNNNNTDDNIVLIQYIPRTA